MPLGGVPPADLSSAQLIGSRQLRLAQTALSQSALTAQVVPRAQARGQAAPQSTPDSVPFLIPSEHEAETHRFVVASHAPLSQSLPVAQLFPSAHFEHEPPQSTSVSGPFFIASVHVV